MKKPSRLTYIIASVGLLATSPSQALDSQPGGLTAAEFQSRLNKDQNPLPGAGQLQMSYAGVVDKILPSVVTVFSYGKGTKQNDIPSIDEIPPQLRPFYDYFRRQLEDEQEREPGSPRGRRGAPRSSPKEDEDEFEPNGVGSGVIISTDGYILTNNHVIGDADKIETIIDVNGTSKRYTAKVIGTDPQTDIALIKIEASGLVPCTMADSAKLRVGDVVLAAGAPMELSRSVTQGIVSALGRSGMGIIRKENMPGYEDFIQTDAAINPGNSGGPLVDALGRVVGINTAIYSRSGMNAGIGFAIPINLALRVAEDLVDDGAVTRGFLGIMPQDIDAEAMKLWGLNDETGALVQRVTKNSPAHKAGIQVGDVITAVNGQKVENASKLPLIVSSHKPGSEIRLDIIRDGKSTSATAKLIKLTPEILAGQAINGSEETENITGPAPKGSSIAEIISGVTVQNLTPGTRQRYEVPDDVSGVIVTQIAPESRAAAMGIEEGDVISSVDRKPVRAVGEAVELAKKAPKTVLLKIWRKGDTMLFMVGKN